MNTSADLHTAGNGIYSAVLFSEIKLMSALCWSGTAAVVAAASPAIMCFYL